MASPSLFFRLQIIFQSIRLVTRRPGSPDNRVETCSGFVCLSWALLDGNSHNRHRGVHLWEQIVWTLNAAGECCAFITPRVVSLLQAVWSVLCYHSISGCQSKPTCSVIPVLSRRFSGHVLARGLHRGVAGACWPLWHFFPSPCTLEVSEVVPESPSLLPKVAKKTTGSFLNKYLDLSW